MRLGLNGQCTQASLEKDLEVAVKAGFDLYEIPVAKLKKYMEVHSLEALQSFFENSPLQPYSLNAITMFSFRSKEEEERLIEELHQVGSFAQELKCPYIVICPSTHVANVSEQQIHEETVRILRKMSDVAAEYHVGLALEFLGFQNCTVNELSQAYAMVTEVNRENVGLSLDTFHFFERSRPEDLKKIDKDKIFLFHINDCDDLPKARLSDADRILPGLGVIPLATILEALQATGYDRMASVELFRDEYYAWDPLEFAIKAKEAAESVLGNVYPNSK